MVLIYFSFPIIFGAFNFSSRVTLNIVFSFNLLQFNSFKMKIKHTTGFFEIKYTAGFQSLQINSSILFLNNCWKAHVALNLFTQ